MSTLINRKKLIPVGKNLKDFLKIAGVFLTCMEVLWNGAMTFMLNILRKVVNNRAIWKKEYCGAEVFRTAYDCRSANREKRRPLLAGIEIGFR